MKKQIAVLMCAVNLDNQRKLLEGMIDAVKETEDNLFVFSHYNSYKDKEENMQGAYQILHLPDFEKFDGAILVRNTIHYKPASEYVTRALQESRIPTVSVDVEIPGMSCIKISSYDAECAMVEHFVTEHGCKEIVYVSGPMFNLEAQKRYQAYCDVLKKYGLPFKEENVYEGGFTEETGREIAKELLKRKQFPKHIICANDAMAMGVMEYFKSRGYEFPEDLAIAGFDNAELSEMQHPPITTVNKNQHGVGYCAVYELLSLMNGGACKTQVVPCKLELRHSCGCSQNDMTDIKKLKNRYIEQQVVTQRMADVLRNMAAEFSGMENPEELIEAMEHYIEQEDIERFYLCLCKRDRLFVRQEDNLSGSIDILQLNTDYTSKIDIPMAVENGKRVYYDEFPKGFVLPEECRNKSGGNYYVAVPIYYQRCCYGYCVCGNSRFPLDHSLFYAWITNVGIGLENIRKWMLLKDTVVKLNEMWVYDTMTNLYNRAGFYNYAEDKLSLLKEQEEKIFLMFMDMDGLKIVNDTLGHQAGDLLIREMADVIKYFVDDDRIAMRYGGDEFVVFGKCKEKENEKTLVTELQELMDRRNKQSKNSFKISASIGISIYEASEVESLADMIELADERMYEEKRKKRQRLIK